MLFHKKSDSVINVKVEHGGFETLFEAGIIGAL